MKKILFLTKAMMTCLLMNSQAQCVDVIKSPEGWLWGYVVGGTDFYDEVSMKALDFSTDGEILNSQDDLLATYNRTTGEVRDQNNDLIMTIEPDGDIASPYGPWLMGKVDEYGVLRDASNAVLLSIAGADPFYISYYYFFYRMF